MRDFGAVRCRFVYNGIVFWGRRCGYSVCTVFKRGVHIFSANGWLHTFTDNWGNYNYHPLLVDQINTINKGNNIFNFNYRDKFASFF